jgi:RimJ/RimL family protein N-acetyltransferase
LRNGLAITLRPLRPDDRERIAAAVRALDRESIYLRLFSYRKELTEAGLDRIMAVDPAHDFVVLATVVAGADEVVIGSARYVAAAGEAGRRTAEVAFMVEEDYRGLGIAGRLLARLAEIARGRGIAEFTAEVLPENKAMLGVFARCGWPMSRRSKDGVVHLTLELRPGALPGG